MISWSRIIVAAAVVCLVVFGAVLVVGNNLPDDNYSTDLVDNPDGKRIIFVNDDMDDAPPGWEFVIEKNDNGDDVLILQPVSS